MAIFVGVVGRAQQFGRYVRAGAMHVWLSKTCLLCTAAIVGRQPVCEDCKFDLPWLLHGCRFCALPIPVGDISCRQCQQQLPPFGRVVAPWSYHFPVNTLIARFKYRSQWAYGRLLALLLAEYLQYQFAGQAAERPDCLLAVPLASKRQRQRGYNQAQMIAQWVGRELGVPVLHDAVRRVRYTSMQQGLSARERQQNMHNAFEVRREASVGGQHVAVVDDVLTTGATSAALVRCLLAAGARRVDVYCLARTGFEAGVV